jgi:hypothetical protein
MILKVAINAQISFLPLCYQSTQELGTFNNKFQRWSSMTVLRGLETLTRMSIPPNSSLSQAASFSADVELETSKGWKHTFLSPSPFNVSSAAIPLPESRAVSTTVRPFLASSRTITYPMPLLPPVTTATVSFVHHLDVHVTASLNSTLPPQHYSAAIGRSILIIFNDSASTESHSFFKLNLFTDKYP